MYKIIVTFIIALLTLGHSYLLQAKTQDFISGRGASQIALYFANLHYTQHPIDDEISQKTLDAYLNRFDPAHIYFLQSDITEFEKHKSDLDDYFREGNIEFALHIFTRFKTRLANLVDLYDSFKNETFDFKKDGVWQRDRTEAPYPGTIKEAQELSRLRFKFDLLTLTLGGSTIEEAKERLITRRNTVWKDFANYTDNDVIALYLNALTSAYDPHSTYMAPDDQENFNIGIKLSLEGIGAVLRKENEYTVVSSIVPGGAASREGSLKVNDKIMAVSQGDQPFEGVVNLRLNDVVKKIRGKRGTEVRLQLLRTTKIGDEVITISIIREKIILKEGEAKSFILAPQTTSTDDSFQQPQQFKIGLIHLPSFYIDFEGRRNNPRNYKSASRDVKKLLNELRQEQVDGIILDLRGNGGGGLDEAISMAGLFIGERPVVITRSYLGGIDVKRSRQKQIYGGPLLVLIDRTSASASEILAGALQDYGRALIVGDIATFGKGTVQNITPLRDPYGALKVTIAQFYRVAGGSTQNKGVESDIRLPSLNNVWEIGESYLENALPWHTLEPLSYEKNNQIQTILPQLKKLSSARVAASKEFNKIQKDISEYLTTVKPKKFRTILEIQEGFKKNEKLRKEREEKARKIIAQEKVIGEEEKKFSEFGGKNIYLEEGIAILEDYIRLTQEQKMAKTSQTPSTNLTEEGSTVLSTKNEENKNN